MKSKIFSLTILISLFVFTTGFIGSCCDEDEEEKARDAEFANIMLKQMENQNKANTNTEIDNTNLADDNEDLVNIFLDDNGVASENRAPEVKNVKIEQLHTNYDDTPHKYLLTAETTDPDEDVLSYSWSTDCGYFVSDTNVWKNTKEWHYDNPGECINATITVQVYDTDNHMTEYTFRPFLED